MPLYATGEYYAGVNFPCVMGLFTNSELYIAGDCAKITTRQSEKPTLLAWRRRVDFSDWHDSRRFGFVLDRQANYNRVSRNSQDLGIVFTMGLAFRFVNKQDGRLFLWATGSAARREQRGL